MKCKGVPNVVAEEVVHKCSNSNLQVAKTQTVSCHLLLEVQKEAKIILVCFSLIKENAAVNVKKNE